MESIRLLASKITSICFFHFFSDMKMTHRMAMTICFLFFLPCNHRHLVQQWDRKQCCHCSWCHRIATIKNWSCSWQWWIIRTAEKANLATEKANLATEKCSLKLKPFHGRKSSEYVAFICNVQMRISKNIHLTTAYLSLNNVTGCLTTRIFLFRIIIKYYRWILDVKKTILFINNLNRFIFIRVEIINLMRCTLTEELEIANDKLRYLRFNIILNGKRFILFNSFNEATSSKCSWLIRGSKSSTIQLDIKFIKYHIELLKIHLIQWLQDYNTCLSPSTMH